METFQTTNISANLFQFGNLRIFMTSQMNDTHVGMVRSFDPTYYPDLSHPMNRTVVHPETGTYFQLIVDLNLCDVILPANQEAFKTHMFKDTVNFMLSSLRQFMIPYTVNEAGFKISFYAVAGSPASQPAWWDATGITQLSWSQAQIGTGSISQLHPVTSLGSRLPGNYVRYVLMIHVDDQFNLVKLPGTPTTQTQPNYGFVPSNSPNWGQSISQNYPNTQNHPNSQANSPVLNVGSQPFPTFNPPPTGGGFGMQPTSQFSFGQSAPLSQNQVSGQNPQPNPTPTELNRSSSAGFGTWTGSFSSGGSGSFGTTPEPTSNGFSMTSNAKSLWGF